MTLQHQYECCDKRRLSHRVVRVWMACHLSGGDAHKGGLPAVLVLLWLSAAVLVLLPVVADVTNVSGWSDPDTLYPTIFSVGGDHRAPRLGCAIRVVYDASPRRLGWRLTAARDGTTPLI